MWLKITTKNEKNNSGHNIFLWSVGHLIDQRVSESVTQSVNACKKTCCSMTQEVPVPSSLL